jgi:hypothetical protein
MEKYLFTDGTNVIREVESDEELQSCIQAASEPAKVRIWIFHTSEWISLADFYKRNHKAIVPEKKNVPVKPAVEAKPASNASAIPPVLKKAIIGLAIAAVILLIYNFTRVTWRKASPLTLVAERPANTPPTNMDSLVETIENLRGQKLDKLTRTNLRIRNTWPDLIQLQLTADRDTSREGFRYHNIEFSIDNATGYHLDNAVVRYTVWKDGMPSRSDTAVFTNITYAAPAKRRIEEVWKGDSITIAFSSIRSKAFNFCFSAEKKSNYGNYNDRWYCK